MSQRDDFFLLLQKLNTQHVKAHPNRPRVLDLPSSALPQPTVNFPSCGSATIPPLFSRQLSHPTTSASVMKMQPSPSNDVWNKLVAVNFRKETVEVSAFSQPDPRPAAVKNQNVADASSLLRILQQTSNKSPTVQTSSTNEGMLAYQCDDQHQLNVSRFIKRNWSKSPSVSVPDGLKVSSNTTHRVSPNMSKPYFTNATPANTLTDSEKRENGHRRRYSSSGEGHAARFYAATSGTGSSSEELEEKDTSMYFYCSDNSEAPVIYPPPDHRQRRNFVSAKHPSHPYGLSSNRVRNKASVPFIKPPEWDDFDLEKDFDFDANLKLFDKVAFCHDSHQIVPDSSTVDPPVKIGNGDELRSLLGIKNSSTQVSSGACPSKDYRPTGSNSLSQMKTNSVSSDIYDPAILFSTTTNVDAHELRKVKDSLLTMSSPSTEEEQEYMDYDLDEAGHDLPCQTKPSSLEHVYEGDSLLMSAAQLLSKIALPEEANVASGKPVDPSEELLTNKHEMSIPPIDFYQVETKSLPSSEEPSDNSQYGNIWTIDNPTTCSAQSLQISQKMTLEERDSLIEKMLTPELYGSNITSYASLGQEMIQLASRDVAHYLMRLIRKHSIQITPSHPIIFILDSGNISSVICLKALYHFLHKFCQCHFNSVEGTLAYVYSCTSRETTSSPMTVYAQSLFQTHLAKLSELQHFSINSSFPLVQIDNLSLSKDTHASINLIIPPVSLSSLANFNLPNLSGSDVLICVDFPLHMSTVISKLSHYYRSAKHLACVMLGCSTCLPWEWRMFLRAVTSTRLEKSLNVALIELPGLLGSGMGKNSTKATSDLLHSYAKLFFTSGCSLLEFMDSCDETQSF